jgi:N4-gp56 family major capsid protein
VAVTTTAVLSDVVRQAWERTSYFALRPQLLFDMCADVKPTRQSQPGSPVTFTIYNDLAVATTALDEVTDETPASMADTQVSVTLVEYGNSIVTTAKLRGLAFLPVDVDAANLIGFNAGKSQDTLARDPLLAGTNALFGGNATNRATIDATDILDSSDVRRVAANMRDANVIPYEDGYYKAFIAPDVAYDILSETGGAAFRPPHEYSQAVNIWRGEIGEYEGFRFVSTSRLGEAELPAGWVNGGAGSTVDVYPTLFLGKQSLAKAFSETVSAPHATVGLGPVVDVHKRKHTVEWYWLGGYGRFREAALWRVEAASSIGANT